MSFSKTLKLLKDRGEDYEFYPTTDEIIKELYEDMLKSYSFGSFLDIGAGNGKVIKKIREITKKREILLKQGGDRLLETVRIETAYAMEKSQQLILSLPKDIVILGTDFFQQTLIDKKVDTIFSNPPYSRYVEWTEKIIKEANAQQIYLVIPSRWGKNKEILNAIKKRGAEVSLIGKFDFFNSEDRKARAKVHLIKIAKKKNKRNRYSRYSHYEYEKSFLSDPFSLWFDESFKINGEIEKKSDFEKQKEKQEKIKREIINKENVIETLVNFYNQDLDKYIFHYKKLEELDYEMLSDMGFDIKGLKESLKQKIENIKLLYWKELFDNLEDINSRLITKVRNNMRDKFLRNTHVDFTVDNIKAVVIWIIKNANQYYKEQMLDIYDKFTTTENVIAYKSNKHFTKDTWRYNKVEGEKYFLDYRIILGGYQETRYRENDNSAYCNQVEALNDIIVIAKNLGFEIRHFNSNNFSFQKKNYIYLKRNQKNSYKKGDKTIYGTIKNVYCHTNIPNKNGKRIFTEDGIDYIYDKENTQVEYQYKINEQYYWHENIILKDDVFATIKFYKNGNTHFQFNKKFIKKLNLEVGRIRGWIKSPDEASREFDISAEEANEFWGSTFTFLPENATTLLLPKSA